MYRHWHRFGFGLPPFGFWFRGPGFFPRRNEYRRMLEDYRAATIRLNGGAMPASGVRSSTLCLSR